MELNIKYRNLSLFLIAFILFTDIAVLYDIPYLRQFSGFLFLFLPGFFILRFLRLNRLSIEEKFLLSIGVSISFLLFFGLFMNEVLFNFGYMAAFSTSSLLFSFNFIYLFFIIEMITSPLSFRISIPNLSSLEKLFLLILTFFPLIAAFGISFMNNTNNNIFILYLYVAIAIYLIAICVFNQKLLRIFPAIILLISFSLLLLYLLRFSHIFGRDIHFEYYFFQRTLNELHWAVIDENLLNVCLCISILPTIFQSLMETNNEEFLFRILPIILCSLTPLAIYTTSKKFLGEIYSFLASFFFIFQYSFLKVGMSIRTNIAIFFAALVILVIFNENLSSVYKKVLSFVFVFSLVVSHYTTTYLFFYLIIFSSVVVLVLPRKDTQEKSISMLFPLLFFAIIFFCYSMISSEPFYAGISLVKNSILNLVELNLDSRYEGFSGLTGKGIEYGLIGKLNFVTTWLSFIFIGIGLIGTVKDYYSSKIIYPESSIKSKNYGTHINLEYILMALGDVFMLSLTIILPYVSIYYGLDRLYSFATIILSVCFILGGIKIAKSLNVSPLLLILLILIPYFFMVTNVTHQIAGSRVSVILNSDSEIYVSEYVHDQDSYSAKWLGNRYNKNFQIQTDWFGINKLVSQGDGNILINSINNDPFYNIQSPHYVSFNYNNVVNDQIMSYKTYQNDTIFTKSDFSKLYLMEDKIYSNGGSEIYYSIS